MRTATPALVVLLGLLNLAPAARGQAGADSYNTLYKKLKDSVGPGGPNTIAVPLEVVGTLPPEASTPTDIDAFVSARAKDPAAARALVQHLASAEAEAIYKEHKILPAR